MKKPSLGRCARVALLGMAALVGIAGAAEAQGMFPAKPDQFAPAAVAAEDAPLSSLTPVTDAQLRDPPPGEWLLWRRTYDGWGYSPLDQINRSNVGELQTAWSWTLPPGATETAPLVHDGVLFVQSGGDEVDALNAKTGDLLWRYTRTLPRDVRAQPKKGLSIYGDKILIGTSDGHVVALDMKTGQVIWDQAVEGGGVYSGAPLAVNGKLIISATNCVTFRCYITGHDIATGKELWRLYTVAGPEDPGGNSWNGLPLDQRYGGSSWTSGSYDPKLNLVYWGVGQPYPWNAFARGTSPKIAGGDNRLLYTDSTLAIDPDTGKLAWFYQHLPNDSWDMDYTFERELIDLPVDGRTRKVAVTSGKLAILEGLDAETGKFVFAHDLGLQDVVQSIDLKSGEKTYNPAALVKPGETFSLCPHPGGARNFPASAYDPKTRMLYFPLEEHCTDLTPQPRAPGAKIAFDKFVLKLRPGSDGNLGRLDALRVGDWSQAWSHRERSPQSTAALPTAGGVVFEGDLDRYFTAYDARTGAVLWRTRLNDTPNGFPITYTVDGRQYVALTVGSGSPFTRTWGNLMPDVRDPKYSGAALWVFALPERR